MDCRVVVEAAVPVYDVGSADEAIRIAIAKTGKMLNPDLSYVDIQMGTRTTPGGEELPPAFVAADEALVALELSMTVFNVEGDEHASRIARSEIGKRLDGVPLKVLERERVEAEADDEDATAADDTRNDSSDENGGPSESGEDRENEDGEGVDDGEEHDDRETDDARQGELGQATDAGDGTREERDDAGDGEDDDEDLLPEFEEMVEENRR